MSNNCPSDSCAIKKLCSEMHRIGCGSKPSWLAVVLFVRNLVANFSIFTDEQKSAMQRNVFERLSKKDPSPQHFEQIVNDLEGFIANNQVTVSAEEKLESQKKITSSLASVVNEFLDESLMSEKERGKLINTFGRDTLEILSDSEDLDALRPRLKGLLKNMLMHYREKANEWERKARLLEQTVNVDPLLAPLHNRRYLESYLKSAIQQNQTDNNSLALLMLDIDNFKQVNDAHGHQVGDDVLRTLAKIISAHSEKFGWFAARYGGDELVVVCNVSVDEALLHSDAIRLAVQNYEFRPRLNGKLAENSIRFTVSIGVAEYQVGMSSDDLLNCADKAMYDVKGTGKNNVALFGVTTIDPEW
ncbi:GGDEF domain-containing protein [Solidesulfovibrio magneticus]|uniref:diguanylate cyclase n=1 Tax=Solidesulfovibrio magneticus (strain ATCC 700980 / DSM 13731 / RS-1) TaxID=573370 RepID=C4XHN1_SOLM1|nr:GGDEF domain-containing protein [Solidesulfovibrio magneticus]BAH76405.1 GGDEF domain protein [Solidesulfovibrio magneticus RS-1]